MPIQYSRHCNDWKGGGGGGGVGSGMDTAVTPVTHVVQIPGVDCTFVGKADGSQTQLHHDLLVGGGAQSRSTPTVLCCSGHV